MVRTFFSRLLLVLLVLTLAGAGVAAPAAADQLDTGPRGPGDTNWGWGR